VNDTRAKHDQLTMERTLAASRRRVFAAFADAQVRARWTVPSDDEVLTYSQSDFRTGGIDRFRCGLRSAPAYEGEVRYLDVVPDERIIYSEALWTDGSLVAVSLITWEFRSAGDGTRLILTDQMVSLAGHDLIEGSRVGYTAALDNLDEYLTTNLPTNGTRR
jgi:uncharacterized protein YndB with AHSA1/START domain